MQVVIAEHDRGAWPERTHEAQDTERIGAAVDHVAHEPELIARRVKANSFQEPSQCVEASLDVAYRVNCHLIHHLVPIRSGCCSVDLC
jgi:hypothetical protein